MHKHMAYIYIQMAFACVFIIIIIIERFEKSSSSSSSSTSSDDTRSTSMHALSISFSVSRSNNLSCCSPHCVIFFLLLSFGLLGFLNMLKSSFVLFVSSIFLRLFFLLLYSLALALRARLLVFACVCIDVRLYISLYSWLLKHSPSLWCQSKVSYLPQSCMHACMHTYVLQIELSYFFCILFVYYSFYSLFVFEIIISIESLKRVNQNACMMSSYICWH